MKLKTALNIYLKLDRAPQSTAQYRYVLTRLLNAIGPDRRVNRVTFVDLVDYYADQRIGRAPLTISGYISIAKAFFNWCVAQGYATTSPAKGLQQRDAERSDRNRAIPADELRRMVDYARATSPRNYALLLFLADTACRVGGLSTLQIHNLDLPHERARIREKGGRTVSVFFSDTTALALVHWLERRPPVEHDYVWTGPRPDYAPLSAHGLADVVRRLAVKTGASRAWGPHSIRHAVGHAYQRRHVPPNITQRKLNHKRLETTMRSYYPDGQEYVEEISRVFPLSALVDEPQPIEEPVLKLVKSK